MATVSYQVGRRERRVSGEKIETGKTGRRPKAAVGRARFAAQDRSFIAPAYCKSTWQDAARHLRAAMPAGDSGSTVGQQAELVRARLEIERIRLGGRLAFRIDVPDALAHERCRRCGSHRSPPRRCATVSSRPAAAK